MAHFLCHLGCSHFGALLLDFYFTENSVYTEEMFLKRNAALQMEAKELQSGIEELEEVCHNKSEYEQARNIFLPTTAHILDYHDRMMTEEKDRLWKLLTEKITYSLSKRPFRQAVASFSELEKFRKTYD